MTCCEGCTSCNGFSLLVLLLSGVVLNAIPLIVNRVEEGKFFQNPISCFEWWYPGIIGAGLMMFLSSFFNVITIIGAVYCMLVSLSALLEGPLICNSPSNSTCKFSFENLRIDPQSLNLQWFSNGSCVAPNSLNSPIKNDTMTSDLHVSPKEKRHRTIFFSAFVGLLLVGFLELLFALSQIVIGFLGCLCGVSKRRSRIV
ncbi:transmembrane 4 L6 family member 20 isoform X2 [Pipistrellus kuhlii]|uniref:transmembrane 4 L6 family member 20 isoform X2 n=1 Tax=Pipistrellus kuhlii TaxID=59472 RepID=UPI001E27210D|nr:transmembrane 4 L6 family member 20 isoform X2 [Pipistrellus kuhlii]